MIKGVYSAQMSTTTMTLTLAPGSSGSCCPNCGVGIPSHSFMAAEAQRQIQDLQAQVRLLNAKATAAVDRWADYEDEIKELRAARENLEKEKEAEAEARASLEKEKRDESPPRFSYLPVQNRLSSFLTTRKSTSNLQAPPPSPTPTEAQLAAELTKEQRLRAASEKKLDEASGELEDLTAQLFQQANEMVATERKARAKLEERVAVLESRDGEKRRRLEKLEGAVARIDRVRGLLSPGK